MDIISSDTGLTIGIVITLAGGVAWLTRLHALASANAKELKHLDARMESQERASALLTNQITEINTKLDYIIEELRKHHS